MLVIQTPSIGKTVKATVVQPTPRKSGALQMAIMDWNGNCYKPALESLQREATKSQRKKVWQYLSNGYDSLMGMTEYDNIVNSA